jgi:hypothetical protein
MFVNKNNIFIYVGKLFEPSLILVFFLMILLHIFLKIITSKLSPRDPTKAQATIPIPRWSGDAIFVRKILNFT